jgi:hypothetical protein
MESQRLEHSEKMLIAEQAAQWLLRAESSRLTRADRRLFMAWLKRSPDNIAALLQISALEGQMSRQRVVHLAAGRRLEEQNAFCGVAPPHLDENSISLASRSRGKNALLGVALSSTYLERFRRSNRSAKMALGGLSVLTICAAALLSFQAVLPAAAISIGFLAAIALKEAVLGYRISHGLFGNTASEARLLLRFLIQNSTTIDFDDGNGRPRPVFEQATRATGRQSIPAGVITE